MSGAVPAKSMAVDLTSGSITKTILRFSWPMILSNTLQMVYTLVDMAVVGKFVGKEGLSAVTNGGDLTTLITFICFGFATAGQVIIAQHLGSGRGDRLTRIIGTMFSSLLLTSLGLSVLGLFLVDWALALLNVPEAAFVMARQYTACCFTGLFFIYGYNIASAILRGMGDSMRPLVFIAIAAVANAILDFLFVAGFHWDALGAALATVLSQGFSFLFSIVYLYRRRESFGFDFRPRSFAIDASVLRSLLRLGLPIALEMGVIQASRMFVYAYINVYGVAASAAWNPEATLPLLPGRRLTVAYHTRQIGWDMGVREYEKTGWSQNQVDPGSHPHELR